MEPPRPGMRVFRWIIMSEGPDLLTKDGRTRRRWLCRCDCGSEKLVLDQSLRLALRADLGGSRSCGCLAAERSMVHGHNRHQRPSAEYMAWLAAKKRCANPRNASYANYGGRGIRMCTEWSGSFDAFLRDMGPKPDPTYSLDRIDPNGNYEPSNCRWAPPLVQARNKRTTNWYELDGERLILGEIAARLGITRDKARALELRGLLPARRVSNRPFTMTGSAVRPIGIDLNDVMPFGWPCVHTGEHVMAAAG